MHQIRRYIRRPEILNKTGVCATTIYNMEKRGEFPMHFMLTPRCAAWDEAAVDAWMESRRATPAQAAPAPDVRLRAKYLNGGMGKNEIDVALVHSANSKGKVTKGDE